MSKKRKRRRRSPMRFIKRLAIFAFVILIIYAIMGHLGITERLEELYNMNQGILSDEVRGYQDTIEYYAKQEDIDAFVPVIQAMMMQESKGKGTDPMQCSECPLNTAYPQTPGGITDPVYSIGVGTEYFALCLDAAGCTSPTDTNTLKLALQGYNYGNGYIGWAAENYGGYSDENALLFSEQMAKKMEWDSYGDPGYAERVLRYYVAEEKATQ